MEYWCMQAALTEWCMHCTGEPFHSPLIQSFVVGDRNSLCSDWYMDCFCFWKWMSCPYSIFLFTSSQDLVLCPMSHNTWISHTPAPNVSSVQTICKSHSGQSSTQDVSIESFSFMKKNNLISESLAEKHTWCGNKGLTNAPEGTKLTYLASKCQWAISNGDQHLTRQSRVPGHRLDGAPTATASTPHQQQWQVTIDVNFVSSSTVVSARWAGNS